MHTISRPDQKARTPFQIAAFLVCLLLTATTASGQFTQDIDGERRAQTGFKFLSMSVSPRAAAMGDAVTTLGGSSESMFYNPAGMANMGGSVHLGFSQAQWIADIDYSSGSVAFQPAQGQYGVVGVSLSAVSYGQALETIRADNDQGFIDLGTIEPSAFAVGLGYARGLTDRFSVGGHLKYAHQSLGSATVRTGDAGPVREEYALGTMAFDFGVIYETGFRSLAFGINMRNFAPELTYAEESFELPLLFQIGVSIDVMDFTEYAGDAHSLFLSVDTATPRDFSEQIKIGGEYRFQNMVSLRGGYVAPTDEQGINLGAGVNLPIGSRHVEAAYNYTDFGLFGGVHRIGVGLGL